MTNYSRKIFFGGFSLTIANLLGAVFNYLYRYDLSQKLSINDFGLFYSILGFFGLLVFVFGLGLDYGIINFTKIYHIKEEKDKMNFLFSSTLIIKFIPAFLFVLSYFLFFRDYIINGFFKDSRLYDFLDYGFLYFVIFIFIVNVLAILNGLGKFHMIAFWVISQIIFVFFVSLFFDDIKHLFFIYMIPGFFMSIFSFIYLVFYYDLRFNFDKKYWYLIKEYFIYSLPIFMTSFAWTFMTYQDVALLTYFHGSESVGIYNIAMPTINIVWILSGTLVTVFFPILVEVNTKNPDLLSVGIQKIYKYLYVSFLPICFLFYIFGGLIINLLFGYHYISALPVLKIFIIATPFVVIQQFFMTVIYSTTKSKKLIKYIYICMLLAFVFNIMFIPSFGNIGASFGFLIANVLFFIFSFVVIRKHIYFKLDFINIIKVLFILTFINLFVYYLNNMLFINQYIKAILLSVLYFILYVIAIFVFRVFSKKEFLDDVKAIFVK